MAVYDVYGYPLANPLLVTSSGVTTFQIAASTSGAGSVFTAPKTGTITKIGFNATAVTGTSPTFRIGLETVAATRSPSGTYKDSVSGGGGSANAYVDSTVAGTGWTWYTIGNGGYSATAGDILAATIRYQSGTIDGSNNITVATRLGLFTGGISGPPYAVTMTTSAWTAILYHPTIAVQYSDSEVPQFFIPYSSLTNNSTWNTGAAQPDIRGTKFTPQVACRLIGAIIGLRPAASSDFDLELWTGAGTSRTLGTTIDADVNWSNASTNGIGYVPVAPTSLAAGTVYRLALRCTTANNPTTFAHVVFPDVNTQRAVMSELKGTVGDNSGTIAWTDYDNGTDGYRGYPVIPVVDQIDTGSAAASQGHIIGG